MEVHVKGESVFGNGKHKGKGKIHTTEKIIQKTKGSGRNGREKLVVEGLDEVVQKRLIEEKICIVNILKEINIVYELVKEIKCYWNNEIVEFEIDCD